MGMPAPGRAALVSRIEGSSVPHVGGTEEHSTQVFRALAEARGAGNTGLIQMSAIRRVVAVGE